MTEGVQTPDSRGPPKSSSRSLCLSVTFYSTKQEGEWLIGCYFSWFFRWRLLEIHFLYYPCTLELGTICGSSFEWRKKVSQIVLQPFSTELRRSKLVASFFPEA